MSKLKSRTAYHIYTQQLTDTISAVIRKSIATSTLAVVRANCVVADAVTATVVCRTLVHVCACTTFTNEL